MFLPELTILVCVFFITTTAEPNSACTTPDNQQGECTLFTHCSVLYSLLNNLTNENISLLRKSQCGHGTNVRVCCPTKTPLVLQDKSANPISSPFLPKKDECGLFTEYKIIWSETADLGSHPWTVLLKYQRDNEFRFHCGGTLISERYVLTAAHCLSEDYLPKNATLVSVRLGEHNLDTDPDCEILAQAIKDCNNPFIEIPIEEASVHKGYSKENSKLIVENDIALLRLKTKVTFDDFIIPACLPMRAKDLKNKLSGARLLRGGWDINNTDVVNSNKIRNIVLGKDAKECNQMFNLTLTENQFCVIKTGKSKCGCDSGGGVGILNEKYYLAGVETWHNPCKENQVTVYNRIDGHLKWIVDNLREYTMRRRQDMVVIDEEPSTFEIDGTGYKKYFQSHPRKLSEFCSSISEILLGVAFTTDFSTWSTKRTADFRSLGFLRKTTVGSSYKLLYSDGICNRI